VSHSTSRCRSAGASRASGLATRPTRVTQAPPPSGR
jgi:hypothetical protein